MDWNRRMHENIEKKLSVVAQRDVKEESNSIGGAKLKEVSYEGKDQLAWDFYL